MYLSLTHPMYICNIHGTDERLTKASFAPVKTTCNGSTLPKGQPWKLIFSAVCQHVK